MAFKFLFLLALVSACVADGPFRRSSDEFRSFDNDDHDSAEYKFEYKVKDLSSENDFGHFEERDGDNTKGFYYVLLPDSRRQKVTYYVNGDSGFVADVTYEGEARYSSEERDSSFGRFAN